MNRADCFCNQDAAPPCRSWIAAQITLEEVEVMERNDRFFFLHVPFAIAAALLTTIPAAAEERASAGSSAMIRDLLAEKPGQAVCFNGRFKGLKVNVWDDAKAKRVPEPGVF